MILRRKLMILLLTLTALMMVLAVAALASLQGALSDLEVINSRESALSTGVGQLAQTVSQAERLICAPKVGPEYSEKALLALQEEFRRNPLCQHSEVVTAFDRLVTALPEALLTEHDRTKAAVAHDAAGAFQETLFRAARVQQEQVHEEHATVSARLRWVVLGLAAGFLLVINASILLMVRAANLVLQPVDKLLEASRQLAQERFEHRVDVGQHDEFEELADAYNHLAQRLQDSETRKLETLKQAAAMLNHELNNAMAIIELQLSLLRRRSDEEQEQRLRQIHEVLRRMASVVESLKHIRRIVLTDYDAQTKMLDLQRSVQDDPVIAGGQAGV